jgi:hypothetical protein
VKTAGLFLCVICFVCVALAFGACENAPLKDGV